METVAASKSMLIADDHPMTRRRLAQLVEEQHDLSVCAEAAMEAEALAALEEKAPDVVLLDLTLEKRERHRFRQSGLGRTTTVLCKRTSTLSPLLPRTLIYCREV